MSSVSRECAIQPSDTATDYYYQEKNSNSSYWILSVRKPGFLDGERILKAQAVSRVEPIFEKLARSLAEIRELRYIKIFPGRITASNRLSQDRKKNPVMKIEAERITGVELLIDTRWKVIQFYAITSALKGHGRKMVEAVVNATPAGWKLAVVFGQKSILESWFSKIKFLSRNGV